MPQSHDVKGTIFGPQGKASLLLSKRSSPCPDAPQGGVEGSARPCSRGARLGKSHTKQRAARAGCAECPRAGIHWEQEHRFPCSAPRTRSQPTQLTTAQDAGLFLRKPCGRPVWACSCPGSERQQSGYFAVPAPGGGGSPQGSCATSELPPGQLRTPWGLRAPGTVSIPGDLKGTDALPMTVPQPPLSPSTGPPPHPVHLAPVRAPPSSCRRPHPLRECLWHICRNQKISHTSSPSGKWAD